MQNKRIDTSTHTRTHTTYVDDKQAFALWHATRFVSQMGENAHAFRWVQELVQVLYWRKDYLKYLCDQSTNRSIKLPESTHRFAQITSILINQCAQTVIQVDKAIVDVHHCILLLIHGIKHENLGKEIVEKPVDIGPIGQGNLEIDCWTTKLMLNKQTNRQSMWCIMQTILRISQPRVWQHWWTSWSCSTACHRGHRIRFQCERESRSTTLHGKTIKT